MIPHDAGKPLSMEQIVKRAWQRKGLSGWRLQEKWRTHVAAYEAAMARPRGFLPEAME